MFFNNSKFLMVKNSKSDEISLFLEVISQSSIKNEDILLI